MLPSEPVERVGRVVARVHLQEVRWLTGLEKLVHRADQPFHHHATGDHQEGAQQDQDGQRDVDALVAAQIAQDVAHRHLVPDPHAPEHHQCLRATRRISLVPAVPEHISAPLHDFREAVEGHRIMDRDDPPGFLHYEHDLKVSPSRMITRSS